MNIPEFVDFGTFWRISTDRRGETCVFCSLILVVNNSQGDVVDIDSLDPARG
jgi:hypothetical protein